MNRRKKCSEDVKSHNHPSYGFGITIIQLSKYQTWEGTYLTHLYDHVNSFLKEKQSLLETQEEGTVLPSLKKYNNISNCNMLKASWHKCKNATSEMSAGTLGGFTWFKRFMRKNYFTGFRASWKAAVGGTMEKKGKRSPAKRNYQGQYDSVLLLLVQEKKMGQALTGF